MKAELIYKDYHEELLRYVISKVYKQELAEDLLQDVYIKIVKNIDKVDKQDKMKNWVFTITRNTVYDYYKKRKLQLVEYNDDVNTEEQLLNNLNQEVSKCLTSYFEDLSLREQKILELYQDGQKHKDIATELDISLSQSKTILHRIKGKFRKELLSCCDFETDGFGNVVNMKQKKEICEKC